MALSVVTITDLFQGIAQADMEGIARLFTERKYSKGATIFGEILLSEERRLTLEADPPEQEIGDIPVRDGRSEPGYLPVPDRLEGGSVRGDRRPDPATGSRSVTASPRTVPG